MDVGDVFPLYGNNACNSIGAGLTYHYQLANNKNILIAGSGVGLSWANAILN